MNPELAQANRARVEQFRHKYRTGLVTLLFTDIVGSAKLKQALGDRDGWRSCTITMRWSGRFSANSQTARKNFHQRGQQFSFCGARLCAKHQPQRVETQNRLMVCGRAAAGRDNTAALRVKMRIAENHNSQYGNSSKWLRAGHGIG